MGRLPKRNEVINLAFIILSNLEDKRVQAFCHPSDRAVLLRQIRSLIEVIRVGENLLRFLEADAPGADSTATAGSFAGRSESAYV
jgi:hypothetical protein